MGFRNGAYARIWEKSTQNITYGAGKKFTKYMVRLSISKKGNDDKYYQQFSGFAELKGDALEEMRGVKIPENGGLTVRLGDVDLENSYNQESGITYWTPIIWSFDHSEEENHQTERTPSRNRKSQATAPVVIEDDVDDDDLPF